MEQLKKAEQSQLKSQFMDTFINRPVIAIVLSVIICLAGIAAAFKIPVLQFPKIESASLTITTAYVGASADVVKGFITEPVERVAATVPGVDYVESSTSSGVSTVTAWLKINENSTLALAELNTRLSQIRFELPQGAEDPMVSVVRADRPWAVFYLDVTAEGHSQSKLTDYLNRQISPILSNIDGVQKIEITGGRTPAMRVWLDADKLSLFNLSAEEVYSALSRNNLISTMGYSENAQQRIDIVANTQLKSAQEFERLVVKQSDSQLVYLQDIARIEYGSEDASMSARQNFDDAVYLAVWPLPGANEIAIGDELYLEVDKLNKSMPHGIEIGFAYDGTLYMRDALREIFTTLVETVVLVGLVILLLMGSFRTALVPLVTIPISILGAIAAMSFMGFSLNLLTILAVVLSVGLVVDDAIVVVENVARLMRQGYGKIQAALLSSRQLLVPIISMTLTLAAVYAPIGFLSGFTGVLFKEFAFSLAIAVLVSGVVALTLSPIMSANVAPEGGKEGRMTKLVNGFFDRLQEAYGRGLNRVFAWRAQIFFSAIIVMLLALPFYQMSSKELAPIEDQSAIFVIIQAPPQASLNYIETNLYEAVDELLAVDGATDFWQVMMGGGGFAGLGLVPPEQRDFMPNDIMPEVYSALSAMPGLDLLPIQIPSLPSAGQFDVEMVVKSTDDFSQMKEYADKLIAKAYETGVYLFADTDLKIDLPQLQIKLDKPKIADLGLTVADVSQQLSILLSSNYVNKFDAEGKSYRVIPVVNDDIRQRPETILSLTIKTPQGELLPLSSVAEIEYLVQPRKLASFNQQNAFKIYGGVLPGTTKEAALTQLEVVAKEVLPEHYTIDYAGESRQIRNEGNTLVSVLLVSLLIVYLILAIQFNSFRDPLVVILGCIPLALSGALFITFIEASTINIYSQIGLITLIGLIAKNGILIVEFANHVQAEGKSKIEAVKAAATTRLRPILMTTAATILGHFPLVLVTGAGAEARNSIGIILVSGMAIGTLFTLFMLPVFYLWLAEDRNKRVEELAQDTRIDAQVSVLEVTKAKVS